MRTLLLSLLAASLTAAEAIPAIELTWDGKTRPALDEPLAGWWDQALGEAAGWWSAQGGTTVDPRAAVADCRGLHLIGVGVPGAQGNLAPWAAGWWQGASTPLADGLRQVAARWPGYTVAAVEGRLSLEAPGVVASPAATIPAGLRVVIHGDTVAASLAIFADEQNVMDQDALRALVRDRLRGWRLTAVVESDGRGWIDTGLPARWLAAPEADMAARLPRAAIARAVIAFDGVAIGADLAAVLDPVPSKLAGALAMAQTDLRAIGAALSGTWAIAVTGTGQGIACIPRSATLDRMAQLWMTSEGGTLPAEGATIEVDDGLYLACAPRWWLLADQPARIAAFLAEPTEVAPDHGALAWADATAAPAAELLAQLPGEVLAQWPLPRALIGPGDKAQMIAKDFGWRVEPGRWRDNVTALANAGHHQLGLANFEGRIRVEVTGPVLPWVMPGLAVRWFADHAQDLCGRTALRQHIAARQAAGQGALPEDLVALVPELTSERIAAAKEFYRSLPPAPPTPPGDSFSKQAKTAYVPLPAPHEAWFIAAKTLAGASAALDGEFPAGSTVAVRAAAAEGSLGPEMKLDHIGVARRLAQAGRDLALFGDGEGALLADRALHLGRDPLLMIDHLVSISLRTMRDDAWLISGLTGAHALARLDAWASEPPPAATGRFWQGERLVMGIAAAHWLQLPSAAATPLTGEWLMITPAVWQPHIIRALTARDVVAIDQLLFHWQDRRQPLPPGWQAPGSVLAAMSLPSFGIIAATDRRAAARHVLVRLAWRLHRLGQGGALPADAAAAATAAGPLSVPYADALLPLVYTKRGAGFMLGLDLSGERPTAVDSNTWNRWTRNEPIPADVHLSLPGQRLEIVIDPRLPAASEGGDPASLF